MMFMVTFWSFYGPFDCKNDDQPCIITGLASSVRRALSSKLRGPGFKSQPGTVGGPVTIIMWGVRTD